MTHLRMIFQRSDYRVYLTVLTPIDPAKVICHNPVLFYSRIQKTLEATSKDLYPYDTYCTPDNDADIRVVRAILQCHEAY